MSWDTSSWDQEMLAYYRRLIHLRRTSPALIDGGFQVLLVEAETLVFQRDAQEEVILVVAHRGEDDRPAGGVDVQAGGIPDGLEFEEQFTHQRTRVVGGQFLLPAMGQGAQVWVGRS